MLPVLAMERNTDRQQLRQFYQSMHSYLQERSTSSRPRSASNPSSNLPHTITGQSSSNPPDQSVLQISASSQSDPSLSSSLTSHMPTTSNSSTTPVSFSRTSNNSNTQPSTSNPSESHSSRSRLLTSTYDPSAAPSTSV